MNKLIVVYENVWDGSLEYSFGYRVKPGQGIGWLVSHLSAVAASRNQVVHSVLELV